MSNINQRSTTTRFGYHVWVANGEGRKVKPKQDDENWWYIEACDEEGTCYSAQFSLRQETYGLEAYTCDGVFAGAPGTWEVLVSYIHTRLWL